MVVATGCAAGGAIGAMTGVAALPEVGQVRAFCRGQAKAARLPLLPFCRALSGALDPVSQTAATGWHLPPGRGPRCSG